MSGGLVCTQIDCHLDKRADNGDYDYFLTRQVTIVNGMGSWADPKIAGVAMYASYETDGYDSILQSPKIIINETDPWHDFGAFDNGLKSFYITNSGTEPICVAAVSMNTPKGPLVISGNLAKICHVNSYESQVDVLSNDTACVWIDRHGLKGIQVQGLNFDVTGMDEEKTETSYFLPNSTEDLCTTPFISSYVAEKKSKRSQPSPAMDFDFRTQLVKSHREGNSAARLCADEFTMGPDFVSLTEELYCDMETRNLYPVCNDSATSIGPCFDLGQDELVEMGEHVAGEKRWSLPFGTPICELVTWRGACYSVTYGKFVSTKDEEYANLTFVEKRDLPSAPRKVMKSFEKVQLWN